MKNPTLPGFVSKVFAFTVLAAGSSDESSANVASVDVAPVATTFSEPSPYAYIGIGVSILILVVAYRRRKN